VFTDFQWVTFHWTKSRQSGHNPNFRVLSGRRSLAGNTDSWGFLFGLVNERIGDDVFIDNSTTALPKRSVTLFGQPPSSALLFIHPATVHFDLGKGAVDLTNIPGGQELAR
jgi:hypothetical protein